MFKYNSMCFVQLYSILYVIPLRRFHKILQVNQICLEMTFFSPRITISFSLQKVWKMGDLFPRDDRQQTPAAVAPPHSILKNKGVSFHTVSLTDCFNG
jgi:hypothetical protein